MVGKDRDIDTPDAPGWYPDPWSATGAGERYFDGKKWGSTERPMAGHAVATVEEREAKEPGRTRRVVVALVAFGVLVSLFLVVPRLLDKDSDGDSPSTGTTVTTVATRPPAGAGSEAEPLGIPAAVPDGDGRYEFLQHQTNDPTVPVAWDPCRSIHYVVNPAGAPADGAALLDAAVARVQLATGLQFVNDGTTDEPPTKERPIFQPARYGADNWAPVLVSWSDEATVPLLAGHAAGVATPLVAATDDGDLVNVSGYVTLDAPALATAAMPDRKIVQATIQHELGHLVGLDHTDDRRQLMFAEGQATVTDYADGDRRGLALLGTQPCHPEL
jgi:hypothetical protein